MTQTRAWGWLALVFVARASPALAAPAPIPPMPARWVTDEGGFLSPGTREELDERLHSFARDTRHQLLLWVGRTLGGTPIEDWAARTFAAWRVGRKGIDDGVVIFILTDDRKVRIEVGYGLEGQLPDLRAAQVVREVIVPRIRAGDHDGGARAGVQAIIAALGGSPAVTRDDGAHNAPAVPGLGWPQRIALAVLLLFAAGFAITHPRLALALLVTFASNGGRRRGGFGGGGFGGGGFGGGGGFSGGGGRSGGGGATGSW